MELINIKDLINELKKKNIDLGKGNPYNRLRYYTKIGWIDHMVRKKDLNGVVVGHYPKSVIEKIIEIENLKKDGKNNEEITHLLKEKLIQKVDNKKIKKVEFLKFLLEKININIIILLVIVLGFIFELNNYNSLKEKLPINQNQIDSIVVENKILEKGKNVIPSGKNKIFINSKKINEKSIVLLSFEGSIAPANYYFITQKILEEGFLVETNYPVAKDVNFSWIIIN
jgi:hypothetical protein